MQDYRRLRVWTKTHAQMYQIMLARDYGVMGESDWKSLSEETVNIRRMLCGLRAKVLEADDKPVKTDKRLTEKR